MCAGTGKHARRDDTAGASPSAPPGPRLRTALHDRREVARSLQPQCLWSTSATGSADAALPGSWSAHVPPGGGRHPGVSRADWPAGAAAHSPASKRPIDLPQGAQRAAKPPHEGDGGGRGSSGTGRAQRRRCLPCAPPGGRIGKARRSVRSSALPRRRGAGTWPGSPAARGGCPAVALYQRLHRPVRGRLRRQAYLGDHSCASRCCPLHTPRQGQAAAAALGGVGWKTAPRCGRAPVPRAMLVQRHGRARRSGTACRIRHRPMAQGASRAYAWRDDARHALRPVLHGGPPPGRRRRLTPAPAGSLARCPAGGSRPVGARGGGRGGR